MRSKIRCVLLILLAALCLAGCAKGGRSADGKTYTIYYTNLGGTRLEGKNYTPVSSKFDGILEELLGRFQYSGFSDVNSAMPEKVNINGYAMGVDDLQIDFDANYLSISNTQEVLLRAGLVKTLVQLPGVLRVRFTVEGQPWTDSDGREISAMNEDTFIDSQKGGINSYHYLALNLYFANQSGDKVVKEMRNVYYSSNLIMEKVIVEQIISGPVNERLLPVTEPGVLVKNVQISKGICVIDLDNSFNREPDEGSVEPEICLYAFVNAICDACDVKGVQFRIDGESDVRFRGQVNLDRTFERNADVIETELRPISETVAGAADIGAGDVGAENGGAADIGAGDVGTGNGGTENGGTVVLDENGTENSANEKNSSGDTGQSRGVGVDPALVEENP